MARPGVSVREILASLGDCGSGASSVLIGSESQAVVRVVLAASVDRRAMDRGAAGPSTLLIACEPLPGPVSALVRWDTPAGEKAARLVAARTTLVVAPEAWYGRRDGFDAQVAIAIGLDDARSLTAARPSATRKVVVFVPVDAVERVQSAAAAAGAGVIGNYADCAFRIRGEGTFLPGPGASPAIGQVGAPERVEEVRLEMTAPAAQARGIVEAIRAAHPYEEPACDVYVLDPPERAATRGWIGRLATPAPVRTILSRLGARAAVAVDGTAEPAYSFAAVAGGTDASGEALRAAQEQGAELFITGVCSPAERMIQRDAPTAVTEAGFERSLLPGLRALAARLAAQFAAAGLSAETD